MPEYNQDYDLSPAQVHWNDHAPISKQFDDIYFSLGSGLEESEYVFLKNNQLPDRLIDFAGHEFVVGEIGFGSGLNFLTTWKSFQKAELEYERIPALHFISFEKHPLRLEDLQRIHLAWPSLSDLSQQMINQYPLLTPGWHRMRFNHCTLDIWLGDALSGLQDCNTAFDAIYLDGFAPNKNPDLWDTPLINTLTERSHKGTSFSTFTAAGHVKRALTAAGFAVKKVKGFGYKRDMLAGHKISKSRYQRNSPHDQTACVIGAGVSGATVAWQLAERGWTVHLYETEEKAAQKASGNNKAVLYTKVTPHATAQNDFYRLSYAYAIRFWKARQQLHACGVLQLLTDDDIHEKSKAAFLENTWQHTDAQLVNTATASFISGQTLHHPAVWFPSGGWLDPQSACTHLIAHPNILFHPQTTVLKLQPDDANWSIITDVGEPIKVHSVVMANGRAAESLWPNAQPFAELRIVRGQTTSLELANQYHPQCVVNHKGYCIPGDNRLELGGTFQPREHDLSIRAVDHETNLKNAVEALPHLRKPIDTVDPASLSGRVGIRCLSLDHLPLAGKVPHDGWKANNRLTWPHLYLCTAMSSRGFTSAPLAADLIASMMNGESLPVSQAIAHALSPDRFLLRRKLPARNGDG